MKIQNPFASALALILASALPVSAVALEDWQFDDEAGTNLPDLSNSAGTAFFAGAAPHAVADGAGMLSFTQGEETNSNVFRNAALTVPDQSTGKFELSFVYTSADLSGGDATGANVSFGMRDAESNSDLFLLRLQKQNDKLLLQHRVGSTNTELDDFGTTSLSDELSVRVVADLDSDTFDVFWSLGTGGEKCSTNNPMSDTELEFDIVRIAANTNSSAFGADDQVDVDFLTVSTYSETTTPAPAIEEWPFDDEAGASLNDAENVAGSATLGNAAANVVTDGLGSLVFSQSEDTSSVYRNSFITNPDQTTGKFELEYYILSADVTGVQVDGVATGANVGFGMRDSESNTDLFLVRLQLQNNTLRLQARAGSTTTTLEDFGVTSLSDLVVRTVADLDTDTFTVYWKLGADGVGKCIPDIPMSDPDLEFDMIRTVGSTSTAVWGDTDMIELDSLTIRDLNTVTEPALTLAIENGPATGQVTLIWPNSTPAGAVLTSSPDLQAPWTPVEGTPIIVGDNYELVLSTGSGFLGFRLETP